MKRFIVRIKTVSKAFNWLQNFLKKSVQTIQAHDQSPQVSPAAITCSCYNNLPLTSTLHQEPKDSRIQNRLTQNTKPKMPVEGNSAGG